MCRTRAKKAPSIVQAFHEGMTRRGGRLYAVIADVCAMANTNGGTIYIGVSAKPKEPPVGVPNISESVEMLRDEIEEKITPPLEMDIDVLETHGKPVIRIQVPRGDDPPYAIDDNKIYVRDEAETNLAVRDEIVQLVMQNLSQPGWLGGICASSAHADVCRQPCRSEAPPRCQQTARSKRRAPGLRSSAPSSARARNIT